MERLGVPADRTALVGDTTVDMAAGRAAGVHTIQVLWGYEREPLPDADETVATWDALRARILRS
jgi:phosphoglycolate phosphatase-like HAD superfamily hydrolase